MSEPWSDGVFYFSSLTFRKAGSYTVSFLAEGVNAANIKSLVYNVQVRAKTVICGAVAAIRQLNALRYLESSDRQITLARRSLIESTEKTDTEIDAVKSCILILYAALPMGSLPCTNEKSVIEGNEDNNTNLIKTLSQNENWNEILEQSWRGAVVNAKSPLELMECLLLLEGSINSSWLKSQSSRVLTRLPSPQFAIRSVTLSSVALRVFCLDRAIDYDKVHLPARNSRRTEVFIPTSTNSTRSSSLIFRPPSSSNLRKQNSRKVRKKYLDEDEEDDDDEEEEDDDDDDDDQNEINRLDDDDDQEEDGDDSKAKSKRNALKPSSVTRKRQRGILNDGFDSILWLDEPRQSRRNRSQVVTYAESDGNDDDDDDDDDDDNGKPRKKTHIEGRRRTSRRIAHTSDSRDDYKFKEVDEDEHKDDFDIAGSSKSTSLAKNQESVDTNVDVDEEIKIIMRACADKGTTRSDSIQTKLCQYQLLSNLKKDFQTEIFWTPVDTRIVKGYR